MNVLAALQNDVPEVPDAATGVAWLRSHVARFSNGATHARRRALAIAELAELDPAALRERATAHGGHPAAVLAAAMGIAAELPDIVAVAACYQPHIPVPAAADAALERLVAAFGGGRSERVAARIGLLIQACAATATLVEAAIATGRSVADVLRDDPPVRSTRRGDSGDSGDKIVDLAAAGLPFGAGPHACPGRDHALALATALVERKPT